MLDNTEGAIKNGQSKETGNIVYIRRRHKKQNHDMCWTPLRAKKNNVNKT